MKIDNISKAFVLILGMILGSSNLFAEDLEITATAPREGITKFEVKFDQDAQISDFTVPLSRLDGWGEPTITRNGNSFSVEVIDTNNIEVAVLDGNGLRLMFHLDGSVYVTRTEGCTIDSIKVESPRNVAVISHLFRNIVGLRKIAVDCNTLYLQNNGDFAELEANCKKIEGFSDRINIEKVKLLGDNVSIAAGITPLKSLYCPNAEELTIGKRVRIPESCSMDIGKNTTITKE